MSLDRLTIYLAGRNDVANKLYELCLATVLGALVLPRPGRQRAGTSSLPAGVASSRSDFRTARRCCR